MHEMKQTKKDCMTFARRKNSQCKYFTTTSGLIHKTELLNVSDHIKYEFNFSVNWIISTFCLFDPIYICIITNGLKKRHDSCRIAENSLDTTNKRMRNEKSNWQQVIIIRVQFNFKWQIEWEINVWRPEYSQVAILY